MHSRSSPHNIFFILFIYFLRIWLWDQCDIWQSTCSRCLGAQLSAWTRLTYHNRLFYNSNCTVLEFLFHCRWQSSAPFTSVELKLFPEFNRLFTPKRSFFTLVLIIATHASVLIFIGIHAWVQKGGASRVISSFILVTWALFWNNNVNTKKCSLQLSFFWSTSTVSSLFDMKVKDFSGWHLKTLQPRGNSPNYSIIIARNGQNVSYIKSCYTQSERIARIHIGFFR